MKRFLRPIKFIKKYEDEIISMSLTQKPYKLYLFCGNSYTVIYYKNLPNIKCYNTICYFKEKKKIVCCYVNEVKRLRINRDVVGIIDYDILIQQGVPLL